MLKIKTSMKSKKIDFNDEKTLVKELKKYNEDAFDFFVLKYQKIIISYVNKLVNNKDEAWNISQEVFISVFRNIKNFREDSSIKTWLFKIARNYTINRLKYLSVRKTSKHSYIDDIKEKYPNYEIKTSKNPFNSLTKKEEIIFLEKALNELPDKDREIIILKDLNELNYEEIGDILDISLSAVKSRLFRAREKLKKVYQNISGGKYER